MAQEAIRIVSPVGRIIWGSVSERAAKDYDGKDYEPGKGPYQFGLAIRKVEQGLPDFLGKIYQQAIAGYPNNAAMHQRIQNEWQSGFAGLSFRFKIKDGDKPNAQGVVNPNSQGCYVLTLSTVLPFKCSNVQNTEIDPREVERGYYADVAISCKVNENVDNTAGVYLNPDVVRLLAFGEKIVGGISIDEAFAGHAAPTQLPPGASLTPVAPSGGLPGMPAQQQQPGHVAALPGMPAQQQAAPQQPGFPGAPASTTQSPINPATGQPYPPHPTFVAGPGGMPG
jgi:hypothetical protein